MGCLWLLMWLAVVADGWGLLSSLGIVWPFEEVFASHLAPPFVVILGMVLGEVGCSWVVEGSCSYLA